MDKQSAIRKIKACLDLSKSPEPHEAARALRHAEALMRKFSIDHPELLAVGVDENWTKSRATKTPPRYEASLALVVAKGFGCELLFERRFIAGEREGGYLFIGAGPAAEVAAYTFAVLARKLQQARMAYSQEKLKRYRRNKIAAADLFCDGWVTAVAENVGAANVDVEQRIAIDAYMGLHHADLATAKTRGRELVDRTKANQHELNGWREGRKAQVHGGITTATQDPHRLGYTDLAKQ